MSSDEFDKSRRSFLGKSVAASSLLLAGAKFAKAEVPCPPSLHGGGVGPASQACIGDVEQDWNRRISAPGVVWFHDFRNKAEVDAFRWAGSYGNDPGDVATTRVKDTVRHVTTDGITGGGCLEIFRFQGSSEGKDWWRPWSPLTAPGNGKAADDPGASGTIPVQNWNPNNKDETQFWTKGGDYGPPSTGSWEGRTFYLQMALKLDSRRRDAYLNGGKITYLTRTYRSLTAQELVTTYDNGGHTFGLYHAGSPDVKNDLTNPPHIVDEWATYLYKVVPGDEYQPNTSIEIWRAIRGATSYTKIFETFTHTVDYSDGLDKAWNALLCSAYHNAFNVNTDFYQRYDQIIFSKDFIPCPQVWA